MRLVLFGHDTVPGLAEALAAEGFELARASEPVAGDGLVGALVTHLRAAEDALGESPPDAAVVCGGGDPALAAALVAVKLGVPTAWVRPPDAEIEVHLTGLVADACVDATDGAAACAEAVTAIAASTLRAP
jgi:hypothetical protein